jgi:hypothetical protein
MIECSFHQVTFGFIQRLVIIPQRRAISCTLEEVIRGYRPKWSSFRRVF